MILRVLAVLAKHGRLVLVVGLVAGVLLPGMATLLKPWIGEMIAFLLFLAALRIGPRAALGGFRDLGASLSLVFIYQIVIPCGLGLIFAAAGFTGPIAIAIVLMTAASSISGSPNITLMAGHDPAPALRLLVTGTAMLPVTIIPVFWLLPVADSGSEIAEASLRLLVVIAIAAVLAFGIRQFAWREPAQGALRALDGLSALFLAVVVVGLMSAIGPAVTADPAGLAITMAIAFLANFGLQMIAFAVLGRLDAGSARVGWSIIAGNRNMGLFFAALPAVTTDPLLLFLGCYQFPMYLTPILLGRFYGRSAPGE